jgi:hypothetical protein
MELQKDSKIEMMEGPKRCAPLGLRETPCYAKCWIDAEITLPPENTKVLVVAKNGLIFCGEFQRITRSIAKDAPKDNRWFASTGWGHELRVSHWRVLPDLPLGA